MNTRKPHTTPTGPYLKSRPLVRAVPRQVTAPSPYGASVPGNAQGGTPPYGQIFPRGKT